MKGAVCLSNPAVKRMRQQRRKEFAMLLRQPGLLACIVAILVILVIFCIWPNLRLLWATITNAEGRKNTGKVLPLKEKLYLNIGGRLVPATKRDVQQVVDKNAAKAFFKANKIKWNKPESLMLLLPFLEEQLNK